MREFVTAVEQAHEDEDEGGSTLVLDGRELRYYQPTDGQFAIYMASTGRHASQTDRIAATVNFFIELFDKNDQVHLSDRLLDRDDPFGVPMMEEIMGEMVQEWTGRPTVPSSGSTPSRKSGGRKSTRRTPAST